MAKSRYAPYLFALIVACAPPSPGPAVQSLLDSYAPDLRIGGRVSAEARRRYQLSVAPYMGYRDSSFTNAAGFADLGILIDEYVDDGDPRVSRHARIEQVWFRVRDSTSIAALIARADSLLGIPETLCSSSSSTGRLVSRYWPGSRRRGLRLVVRLNPGIPADTVPGMATIPVGTGAVQFGAERPTLGEGMIPASCAP